MRSHNRSGSVSATRYAPHPDSLLARPKGECPAFPTAALPSAPSSAVRRSDRSHPCPVPDPEFRVPLRPPPPSHRSYKNHAWSADPVSYLPPPSARPSPPAMPRQVSRRCHSSSFPSRINSQTLISAPIRSSFPFLTPYADPDSRPEHFSPIRPFPHPASVFR